MEAAAEPVEQPTIAERRIGCGRAGARAARQESVVGAVERRAVVDAGRRQAAGIDERPREGKSRGEIERGVAEARLTADFGVMKSVERVEWRMFSSAAKRRSAS